MNQEFKDFIVYFFVERDAEFPDLCKSVMARDIQYRIINFDGNKGLGYALSSIPNFVKESIIVRHDLGDDIFSNRLRLIKAVFSENADIDLVYSDYLSKSGSTETHITAPNFDVYFKFRFAYRNPICHPTVAFRRQSLLRYGSYSHDMRYCEDLDLWLRWYKLGATGHRINTATMRYYQPVGVRSNANWIANLKCRWKNKFSPTPIVWLLSLIVIGAYIMLPMKTKEKFYVKKTH